MNNVIPQGEMKNEIITIPIPLYILPSHSNKTPHTASNNDKQMNIRTDIKTNNNLINRHKSIKNAAKGMARILNGILNKAITVTTPLLFFTLIIELVLQDNNVVKLKEILSESLRSNLARSRNTLFYKNY